MSEYMRRAEREAAAIIAEAMPNTAPAGYERLVSLVAIAWLQGNIAGTHETLARAEQAFDQLRGKL